MGKIIGVNFHKSSDESLFELSPGGTIWNVKHLEPTLVVSLKSWINYKVKIRQFKSSFFDVSNIWEPKHYEQNSYEEYFKGKWNIRNLLKSWIPHALKECWN